MTITMKYNAGMLRKNIANSGSRPHILGGGNDLAEQEIRAALNFILIRTSVPFVEFSFELGLQSNSDYYPSGLQGFAHRTFGLQSVNRVFGKRSKGLQYIRNRRVGVGKADAKRRYDTSLRLVPEGIRLHWPFPAAAEQCQKILESATPSKVKL
jgi:hypothetical protein